MKKEKDILDIGRKKKKESIFLKISKIATKHTSNLVDWLRPEAAGDEPMLIASANDICERASLSSILPYADITRDGFILNDEMGEIRLGFIMEFAPFLVAGIDAESQIENIILLCEVPGSVIQFGVLGSTQCMDFMDRWETARNMNNSNPMINEMTRQRKQYFKGAIYKRIIKDENGKEKQIGYSLAKTNRIHPKQHRYFITVSVPFKGKPESDGDWQRFKSDIEKLRNSVKGVLDGARIPAQALTRPQVRHLLRVLLNMQKIPEKLLLDDQKYLDDMPHSMPFYSIKNLVERDTRYIANLDGSLTIKSNSKEGEFETVSLAMLTVDRFPTESYLSNTGNMLGELSSQTSVISNPFWLYTTIVTLDSDSARDRMQVKMAGVSRQLISDSPAYQAFMSHLFEMRDQLKELTDAARKGHPLVRAYMGINIASTKKSLVEDFHAVSSMWKRQSFEAKQEKFIGLPIFLASLPCVFTPDMDPAEKRSGLQRMNTMTTFQAATLAHMQGEWGGSSPTGGGIPLISRRNELITTTVQDRDGSNNNYNFVIVAATGSGKSFFAQDIVMDFMSRDGIAFIIDAGRSYFELVELLGGVNLVFKVDDPVDLNPFAQVRTETDLKEMMELLKEIIRYMAWPNNPENVPDWQYSIIEQGITKVWSKLRDQMTIIDLSDWLQSHEDRRANDIAEQLYSYTFGRLANWFNGKGRKIDMNNTLMCLEMDELKSQGAFRDVALTLIMHRIANVMYRDGDPSRPKLMMIDEAWDLLASNQAGPFINRAYRTYRKYGGSAGIITQKFGDMEMSEASKAAYASSAWVFMLAQKKDTLAEAFKLNYLPDDDYSRRLIESVHTKKGQYSEIYVRNEGAAGVYRFIVDPFSYWLYTTDPKEKDIRSQKVEEISNINPDWPRLNVVTEACKQLADETIKKNISMTPDETLDHIANSVS